MEAPFEANEAAAGLFAEGYLAAPLATVAALDSSTFSSLHPSEAVPVAWDERARKAWEYYVEEPLVKNCVNSWRTFAVGDEIKIAAEDEATAAADRLRVTQFVKDMILQALVKGDTMGFKRFAKGGQDIAEVVCVKPRMTRHE